MAEKKTQADAEPRKPSVNVPQVKPKEDPTAAREAKKPSVNTPVVKPKKEPEAAVEDAAQALEDAADAAAEKAPAKKKPAKPVGNPTPLRIGAAALWVVAFVFEVLAVLIVLGKLTLPFFSSLTQLILLLVLDVICVIIGSQLWKKANHIDPASEKNKAKFWLWNNMGVIACVIAFVPVIILLLTNKDLDKRTKTIATIVAIVALLIGGAASYDYNPVSAEQKAEAQEILADYSTVYWTRFGRVYHLDEDCQALRHSEELTSGTVGEAIAANRTRLCSFCAKKHGVTGVVTDGRDTDDLVLLEDDSQEADAA